MQTIFSQHISQINYVMLIHYANAFYRHLLIIFIQIAWII